MVNSKQISKEMIRQLRADAHALKPTVLIGQNGLTEAVWNEIDLTLDIHELIKIKINSNGAQSKKDIAKALSEKPDVTLINLVGHTITIYRKKAENKD